MPYIRLYSRDVPLDQKRVLARKLIDITMHAFQLSPEDRNRITIQFLPLRQLWTANALQGYAFLPNYDLTLEVRDRHLTEDKRRAFAAEAAPELTKSLAAKPRNPFSRLLHRKPDPGRQVAIQFKELETAVTSGDELEDNVQHRWAA